MELNSQVIYNELAQIKSNCEIQLSINPKENRFIVSFEDSYSGIPKTIKLNTKPLNKSIYKICYE